MQGRPWHTHAQNVDVSHSSQSKYAIRKYAMLSSGLVICFPKLQLNMFGIIQVRLFSLSLLEEFAGFSKQRISYRYVLVLAIIGLHKDVVRLTWLVTKNKTKANHKCTQNMAMCNKEINTKGDCCTNSCIYYANIASRSMEIGFGYMTSFAG